MVGTISDLYGGRRACVIATFAILVVPFLLMLSEYGSLDRPLESLPTFYILGLLVIIGCLIGGPINIITSAVAVDLSEHSSINGRNDLMTVTGIINGFGSIMASLGLIVVGPLQVHYGWRFVWYLLAASAIIGTCLLKPTIMKELSRSNSSSPTPSHSSKAAQKPYKYGSISTEEDTV